MLVGVILIICGILIAIFPQLLSFIVAFILIFAGLFFFSLGYHYKKISRTFDNPFIDFFFRF
jgi:Flp pilus assembly protein TadB